MSIAKSRKSRTRRPLKNSSQPTRRFWFASLELLTRAFSARRARIYLVQPHIKYDSSSRSSNLKSWASRPHAELDISRTSTTQQLRRAAKSFSSSSRRRSAVQELLQVLVEHTRRGLFPTSNYFRVRLPRRAVAKTASREAPAQSHNGDNMPFMHIYPLLPIETNYCRSVINTIHTQFKAAVEPFKSSFPLLSIVAIEAHVSVWVFSLNESLIDFVSLVRPRLLGAL